MEKPFWLLFFLFIGISGPGFSQGAVEFYESSLEHMNREELDQALLSVDRALEIDSSVPDYYLQRANIFYKLSMYDKTIKDCYSAMRLKNDIPEVYLLRGKVCQVTESFGGAILFFGKAIKYSSDNELLFDAFLNRGKAYYELGKYYDALSDFQSARDINTRSLELLLSMSESFLKINVIDKAHSTLMAAVEIDSSYSPLYEVLGRVAKTKKDYPEAIEAYKKYCELNPGSASAHCMLSEGYLLNGDYEKGMENINIAQSLSPEDPMVFKIKGLIYLRKNEFENGCNNLFRALQLGYLEQYGYDLLDIYLTECEGK
ncbi:MAG: hypothetical protein PVF73_06695 [Bacteroidales bacterium]